MAVAETLPLMYGDVVRAFWKRSTRCMHLEPREAAVMDGHFDTLSLPEMWLAGALCYISAAHMHIKAMPCFLKPSNMAAWGRSHHRVMTHAILEDLPSNVPSAHASQHCKPRCLLLMTLRRTVSL